MNRVLRTVVGFVVGAGLAAGGPTQAPTAPHPTGPKNHFLDGWMAELLEGDLTRARQHYDKAAANDKLPNYQHELALLRLRESSWDIGERIRINRRLEARGIYASGIAGPSNTVRRLRREFAAALQTRDREELAALRNEVRRMALRHRTLDSRPLLKPVLSNLRGGLSQRANPEVDELRRRLQAASKRGDDRTANRLRWEIRRRQLQKSRSASRRLTAKRWTEMTRLHLAGEHERALGMERFLGGASPRFTRRNRRLDVGTAIARVQRLPAADRRPQLEKTVLANLGRILSDRGLQAEEKAILGRLDGRLRKLAETGQWSAALLLAARTPYRSILFR